MQPTQPPAGPDPNYGFAGCYRHPDRLTGVRCVRCNRPICPECQRPASVGFQCPDDVKAGRASVRSARTVVGARANESAVPFVTYGLIAINVLVYILTAVGPGANFVQNSGQTQTRLELVPYLVAANHDYYRLISSMFVHYGPVHILFNMYALYVVGPALERAFGWWRYAAVYLIAGLGGSVACLLFQNPLGASAGASGAIFGLFAALLVMSKRTGTPATQVWIVVGINFVFTFSVPNISIWGHIGGFVFGGLAALALLAWNLRQQFRLPDLRLQLAGLAALVLVLVGATGVRVHDLSANPPQPAISNSR
jgi:membrane associated rhomboid family serine protease